MELKQGLIFGLGVFLVIAFIAAITGNAAADNTPLSSGNATGEHTITVTGTGSVNSVPDTAKFSTGVVTEANSSTDAMRQNAQLMDAVINAIRQSGIQDKDIRTSGITLEPVYNYYSQPSGSTDKPKIVGYRATNTVTVTVRDLSKVGSAIDAANNAGANQVTGVSFELSDSLSSDVYGQALTRAVSNGADKAKTIATAAGAGNLKLKSITESSTYYPQPVYMNFAEPRAAGTAPTPVSPGEQKVQATVTMVYTFA